MVHKVNIKARINRHSKIFKENLTLSNKFKRIFKRKKIWYKIVVLFMAFLMPIYPMFASKIHKNTEYDFYRWDIDESSIIWSYTIEKTPLNSDEQLYEAKDSFLSVSTVLDDSRDLSWTNEIVNYKVQPWDSIALIASKFRVSKDSIYWANNFSKNHVIHPWDVIKIPPVSWVIYKVKKWDTLLSIANKYKVSVDKIKKQNLIKDWKVKVWQEIVIPWAKKILPKTKLPKKTYTKVRKTYHKTYNTRSYSRSKYVKYENFPYKLTPKPKYHTFYWWNCTRYVAKYKTVDWGWNAKDWLKNARKKGHKTWYTPKLWAIVVFHGRWYNPRYGHVWIVRDIKNGYIIVSDMNYRRLWEVTYRKVSIHDRAIRWYIYVE